MRGFTPAPHQGHCPWTRQRMQLTCRTNSFPLRRIRRWKHDNWVWHFRTRTDAFERKDNYIANWLRHCHPRAGRCSPACRMLRHPGKTIEKGRRRKRAFSPGFFFVFIVPVAETAWFSKVSCGNNHLRYILFSRRKGAGRIALPWGTGDEQSPASWFHKQHADTTSSNKLRVIAYWVQGGSPCRRGTGGA